MLRAPSNAAGHATATHATPLAAARAPREPPWLAHIHASRPPQSSNRTTRQLSHNSQPCRPLLVERSNPCPKTTCSHATRLVLFSMVLLFPSPNSNATPRPVLGERTRSIAFPLLLKTQGIKGPNIWPNTTCAQTLDLTPLTWLIPSRTPTQTRYRA